MSRMVAPRRTTSAPTTKIHAKLSGAFAADGKFTDGIMVWVPPQEPAGCMGRASVPRPQLFVPISWGRGKTDRVISPCRECRTAKSIDDPRTSPRALRGTCLAFLSFFEVLVMKLGRSAIEDYAVRGDTDTAALVGRNGSI